MTNAWVIHVVDDDEPVRFSLSFALEVKGFRAITYVDADDFLMRWQTARGVLISDIRMPGMTGIELTRQLRLQGSDMPIILMTGHPSRELQTDAIDAGADLVLGKPVELEQLVAEIGQMMT